MPIPNSDAYHRDGADLADAPVDSNGRIEMLWHLREQAVSGTLHRFGNVVGPR